MELNLPKLHYHLHPFLSRSLLHKVKLGKYFDTHVHFPLITNITQRQHIHFSRHLRIGMSTMTRQISVYVSMAIMCLSVTTALPSPISPSKVYSANVTKPLSAPVVWYQATEQATNDTCGFKVSDGTLQANKCYILHTAALGIQQHESSNCVFKVWNSVSDCSGSGSWTETSIPKGNTTTCVTDNVLDGGSFQHKSGIYWCI